jgi:glycosyltransferase 2 family protein
VRSLLTTSGRTTQLLFGIKIAVAAGLLGFLAVRYDLYRSLALVRDADLTLLIAAFSVLVIGQLCACWRWKIVVDVAAMPVSLTQVVRLSFIGTFFNTTLPSVVGGDAVRMWGVTRLGFPASDSIASVLADRISGLFGLIILVLLTQPLLMSYVAPSFVFAVGGVSVFAAIAFVIFTASTREIPLLRLLPVRLLAVLRLIRSMLRLDRNGLKITVLSLIGQLSAPLTIFGLARAFSFNVGVGACLALVPLVVLATLLPVTIGGWGVREGAIVAAMSRIGLPPEQSLVLSLAFGIAQLLLGLPGGVLWLLQSRTSRQMA